MTPNSTWDSRVSAKDKANLQMWLPFPRGTVSLTETGRLLLLRHVIYLLLFSAWHLPRHTEHLPYDAGVVVLLLWFPGTEEDLKLCKFLQAGVGRGGGFSSGATSLKCSETQKFWKVRSTDHSLSFS